MGSIALVGTVVGCGAELEASSGADLNTGVGGDAFELPITGNKAGVGIGDGFKGIGFGLFG